MTEREPSIEDVERAFWMAFVRRMREPERTDGITGADINAELKLDGFTVNDDPVLATEEERTG